MLAVSAGAEVIRSDETGLNRVVRHGVAVLADLSYERFRTPRPVPTAAFLDAIPQRPAIRARLQALWDHEKWGVPWRRGGRTFEHHNDGLQNQDVLYVRESPEGERRLLLDPNTLSEDGTVAVASAHASRDGKYMVKISRAVFRGWCAHSDH